VSALESRCGRLGAGAASESECVVAFCAVAAMATGVIAETCVHYEPVKKIRVAYVACSAVTKRRSLHELHRLYNDSVDGGR
jgi:hypothetical protein